MSSLARMEASARILALVKLANVGLILIWGFAVTFVFVRALPLFVLGMSLAWFAQKVWIAPRLAGWVGGAAFCGLAVAQAFDKNALISLAMISLIILSAGAVPVRRPSKLVETAAMVSFSMFISNEVVRIAWFGVVNVAVARFALSEPMQWALWGGGVLTAVAFAFAFHFAIDDRIQSRIRSWFRARGGRRGQAGLEAGPVISIEG